MTRFLLFVFTGCFTAALATTAPPLDNDHRETPVGPVSGRTGSGGPRGLARKPLEKVVPPPENQPGIGGAGGISPEPPPPPEKKVQVCHLQKKPLPAGSDFYAILPDFCRAQGLVANLTLTPALAEKLAKVRTLGHFNVCTTGTPLSARTATEKYQLMLNEELQDACAESIAKLHGGNAAQLRKHVALADWSLTAIRNHLGPTSCEESTLESVKP